MAAAVAAGPVEDSDCAFFLGAVFRPGAFFVPAFFAAVFFVAVFFLAVAMIFSLPAKVLDSNLFLEIGQGKGRPPPWPLRMIVP